MRNDYIGFGILKDTIKYKEKLAKLLIDKETDIEKKTLIRIYVNKMSYNEVVKKLEQLKKS